MPRAFIDTLRDIAHVQKEANCTEEDAIAALLDTGSIPDAVEMAKSLAAWIPEIETAQIIIGARVSTKYGPGSISGFERIIGVKHPVEYPKEYAPGDRISVRLDNPQRWILSDSKTDPYFYPSELTPIL